MSIVSVGRRLPAALGAAGEAADLAHDAAGEGDEVLRGEAIRGLLGIGRGRVERSRRDDVVRGGRLQDPLRDAAVLADLRELEQAVRLERLQVVVDLLAGDAHPGREGSGGARLHELGEQPGAGRVERDRGGRRVLDDLDILHRRHPRLDNLVCQDSLPPGRQQTAATEG